MAFEMTAEAARAWKRGFEAARDADRSQTRRESVNPERSIRLALMLIETCRRHGIWPEPGSRSERERAATAVRERWIKLKLAFRP